MSRLELFIFIAPFVMIPFFMNCSKEKVEGASESASVSKVFSYKTFVYDETRWCPEPQRLTFNLADRTAIRDFSKGTEHALTAVELSDQDVQSFTQALTGIAICSSCTIQPDGSTVCPEIGCTSEIQLLDSEGHVRETTDCLSRICDPEKNQLFGATLLSIFQREGIQSCPILQAAPSNE